MIGQLSGWDKTRQTSLFVCLLVCTAFLYFLLGICLHVAVMQWFLLSYALYCSAAYINCYHWWPIPIWQPAKYASCNQVLNFLHFTYFCFRDVHAIIIADPTFDLLPPVKGRLHSTSVQLPVTSHTETVICQNGGQKQVCTADVSCQRQSTKKWDTDVGQLMSSEQWLKIYGLKTAKLDMNHLLRQIGFRHSDGKYSSTYLCWYSLWVVCT